MLYIHALPDVCMQCHFLTDLKMFTVTPRDRTRILPHIEETKDKEIKRFDRQ